MDYKTPRDFSPTTEKQVVSAIHEHPLPEYGGAPKKAHRRIYEANNRILSGLRAYFMIGRFPGDFLCAVLRNDFTQAVGRADNTSTRVLDSLSTYLMCYPPRDSWGSQEALNDWKDRGGYVGRRGAAEAWHLFIERNL